MRWPGYRRISNNWIKLENKEKERKRNDPEIKINLEGTQGRVNTLMGTVRNMEYIEQISKENQAEMKKEIKRT